MQRSRHTIRSAFSSFPSKLFEIIVEITFAAMQQESTVVTGRDIQMPTCIDGGRTLAFSTTQHFFQQYIRVAAGRRTTAYPSTSIQRLRNQSQNILFPFLHLLLTCRSSWS
jgi:hypothetical protein